MECREEAPRPEDEGKPGSIKPHNEELHSLNALYYCHDKLKED
jgi:hypothetical protein